MTPKEIGARPAHPTPSRVDCLAHEYAQNVVMHNDAFEMRRFHFEDPIAAWPKWAQANYEYTKTAFRHFADALLAEDAEHEKGNT